LTELKRKRGDLIFIYCIKVINDDKIHTKLINYLVS